MSQPANVFSENYRIDFKVQQVWSVPHALEFFLLGAGAALYLINTWFWRSAFEQLAAILLVIAAGVSLLSDLGRPERLWRTFSNLSVSWISRGALAVFLFLAASMIGWAARQIDVFSPSSIIPLICEITASFFALVAMLYPGFVLSSYASIPSWNSPMVPFLFFIYSWITGIATHWLIFLISGTGMATEETLEGGLWLLLFTLLSVLTHLGAMARGSIAVREGFRILTRGPLAALFLGMVVAGGLLAPLFLLAFAWISREFAGTALLFSAILILGGGFSFRYCILKAGVYPPLF